MDDRMADVAIPLAVVGGNFPDSREPQKSKAVPATGFDFLPGTK
jgi:hypothetical protein